MVVVPKEKGTLHEGFSSLNVTIKTANAQEVGTILQRLLDDNVIKMASKIDVQIDTLNPELKVEDIKGIVDKQVKTNFYNKLLDIARELVEQIKKV